MSLLVRILGTLPTYRPDRGLLLLCGKKDALGEEVKIQDVGGDRGVSST